MAFTRYELRTPGGGGQHHWIALHVLRGNLGYWAWTPMQPHQGPRVRLAQKDANGTDHAALSLSTLTQSELVFQHETIGEDAGLRVRFSSNRLAADLYLDGERQLHIPANATNVVLERTVPEDGQGVPVYPDFADIRFHIKRLHRVTMEFLVGEHRGCEVPVLPHGANPNYLQVVMGARRNLTVKNTLEKHALLRLRLHTDANRRVRLRIRTPRRGSMAFANFWVPPNSIRTLEYDAATQVAREI